MPFPEFSSLGHPDLDAFGWRDRLKKLGWRNSMPQTTASKFPNFLLKEFARNSTDGNYPQRLFSFRR
jgi:hypothetical protein